VSYLECVACCRGKEEAVESKIKLYRGKVTATTCFPALIAALKVVIDADASSDTGRFYVALRSAVCDSLANKGAHSIPIAVELGSQVALSSIMFTRYTLQSASSSCMTGIWVLFYNEMIAAQQHRFKCST
jgi:hypothetical protein